MNHTEYFLGIDVGGTNVKFGLVSSQGELLDKRKYPTIELRESADFAQAFVDLVGQELAAHPQVHKVGIGVPGMISKDRASAIRMANLPEMNGLDIIPRLSHAYPDHEFYLENDANAAALGEYHFGLENTPPNFLFVTLGTGVGSAVIFDGKIFTGADGNALELGHTVCSTGTTLEEQIGKPGLMAMAQGILDSGTEVESRLYEKMPLTPKKVVKACVKGDPVGVEVFTRGGRLLGEGLVNAIRILDVKTIYIGGGVAQTFDYIVGPARETIEQFLPNYYLKDLEIKMATLGNNAGIVGAASLCFRD